MLKGIKIIDTIDDFLENHPEISVERNLEGKIIKFIFPEDIQYYSYVIICESITIVYEYKGEPIMFSC